MCFYQEPGHAMGHVSLDGIQKILKLDADYPNFQTYTENMEFTIDGSLVKAIATISWRRITIHIIEPFSILAWAFEPTFFALGVSMLHRQEALLKKGMTQQDDFILRAKNAYLRHVTYLRMKPKIDAAQVEFLSNYQDQLESLETNDAKVQARVAQEKMDLRKKFKADQINQKEYQIALKLLTKDGSEASLPLSTLKRKIEQRLEEIRHSMIDLALSQAPKVA